MQLLALHGFSGSPESLAKLALPGSVQRFAPTLAGHTGMDVYPGAPPTPKAQSSRPFEQELHRIHAWCTEHGFQHGHLLGYSMGARLALGLLVTFPSRFTGATLIGVNPGLQDAAERETRTELDDARARQLEEQGLEAFMQEWEALPLFESQRRLPTLSWQKQAQIRRQHEPQLLAASLRECGLGRMPDYTPKLQGLTTPVQLVCGELDVKFVKIAKNMLKRLPQAELHSIPKAGHNPLLEAPKPTSAVLLAAMTRTT